jgi:hypothetical protein
MRRGTFLTLIVLFALLVVVAVVQLTQPPPPSPFPGPREGTPLPSGLTTVPPSSASGP